MSNSGSFSRASSYSPTENGDYTPLQLAVLKGSLDEARCVFLFTRKYHYYSIFLKIFPRKR